MDRAFLLSVACLIVGGSAVHLMAVGVGPNLLVNGNAEASLGAPNFSATAAPVGWTTTSSLTAVQYTASSSDSMNPDDSLAIGGGLNYFAGGPSSALSTATQSLNVSALQPLLGIGPRWFRIGGHIGGFSNQGDNASFKSTIGTDTVTIGPVTPSERANDTSFRWRAAFGVIPAGATSASFVLTATRSSGSYNDGYADNLAFQLTAGPGDATLNRQVNFDDLLIVAQNYGLSGRTWEQGDFTGDGTTGFDDLLLVAQHYGTFGATALPDEIDEAFRSDWAAAQLLAPEPGSAMMAGMACVAFVRRRR